MTTMHAKLESQHAPRVVGDGREVFQWMVCAGGGGGGPMFLPATEVEA